MATVVGFAFWGLAVTPVGKQVFLLLVAVTPNAMHGMTTTATNLFVDFYHCASTAGKYCQRRGNQL